MGPFKSLFDGFGVNTESQFIWLFHYDQIIPVCGFCDCG